MVGVTNSAIDSTAKVYKDVRVQNSQIGADCLLADNCEIRNSTMLNHSEIGRRTLVFDTNLGEGSYIGSDGVVKNTTIGNYCSISWNVSIGADSHNYKAVSMYTNYWWNRVFGTNLPRTKSAPVEIGNDVWIGTGATILAGVKIGSGSIIGASALVNRDVPPYSIWGGVPAHLIKYRFPEEVIERLMAVQWWNWPHDVIAENAVLLSSDIDEDILKKMELISCEFDL